MKFLVKIKSLGVLSGLRIKGHTSVDKFVFTALIVLEGLAANLFLTVDEAITHTMMVEIKFTGVAVDLDHFLPMGLAHGFEVLNQLELVWETASHNQLVFTVGVVGADFLSDNTAVVLVQSDSLDETINLFALRVEIDFAFFVENCLSTVLNTLSELLLVNDKLGLETTFTQHIVEPRFIER